jgi:hypothetical protein
MDEAEIDCPWCGEPITLLLDLSQESASYVEDCSVCCRPIVVRYSADAGELLDVSAEREGD